MSEKEGKKFDSIRKNFPDDSHLGPIRPYSVRDDAWENTNFFPVEDFDSACEQLQAIGRDISKGKVLEIGAGGGMFTRRLLRHGIDAYAIDARPRGTLWEMHKDRMSEGRIEQMPYPDESFETLIGFGVFDDSVYNQDWEAMFRDIHRVLKQGGVFLYGGHPLEPGEGFTEIPGGGLQMWQKTGDRA